MGEHTKELWQVRSDLTHTFITTCGIEADCEYIAEVFNDKAQRIVEVINACVGLSEDEIKEAICYWRSKNE